jgi:hypothetical protein
MDDDLYLFDFDTDVVAEAVYAVIGDRVVYTSIDDEHVFWYVLDDEGKIDEEYSAGAEGLDDIYSAEQLEEVLAYLRGLGE